MKISQFWIDLIAGTPLSLAWAEKDAEIAREALEVLDDLPMRAWVRLDDADQRRLLAQAVAEAA